MASISVSQSTRSRAHLKPLLSRHEINKKAGPSCVHHYSTMPRPYRFHIAASCLPKPPGRRARRLRDQSFSSDDPIAKWRDDMLLKTGANYNGGGAGEDFFYIQEMKKQSGVSFGVADGVGGWIDQGVDPSLFAQALMYHAHRYSKTAWAGEAETDPTQEYAEREAVDGWELTPVQCLQLAYDAVMRERGVLAGSSTACILNLNASSAVLRAANLGDSGFVVIRSSQVIHTQHPQTHFFNCPRQLTKELPMERNRRNIQSIKDYPSDADIYETKLRDGDLVIAYTDGLSDNVFSSEVMKICNLVARAGGTDEQQVQGMADRIVRYARACMVNYTRPSPFEMAAAREGLRFRGGKMDDVTVVVALVQEV